KKICINFNLGTCIIYHEKREKIKSKLFLDNLKLEVRIFN
ncbi:hypothetical protein QG7_3567, partial [Clostridioides difficile CD175]